MEKFENLIKLALQNKCNEIEMENESDGKTIYLVNSGTGFPIELSAAENNEILKFLKKVKKQHGVFFKKIDNINYKYKVKFRCDFGEEVFSLKYETMIN